MDELIANSYQREYKLLAYRSAFETKDKLKAQKYRWDPEKRVWYKHVLEKHLEQERLFLREEIYSGNDYHEEEEVTA